MTKVEVVVKFLRALDDCRSEYMLAIYDIGAPPPVHKVIAIESYFDDYDYAKRRTTNDQAFELGLTEQSTIMFRRDSQHAHIEVPYYRSLVEDIYEGIKQLKPDDRRIKMKHANFTYYFGIELRPRSCPYILNVIDMNDIYGIPDIPTGDRQLTI